MRLPLLHAEAVWASTDYFLANCMRRLEDDNEGHFVVVPEGIFSGKAGLALKKNLKSVTERPTDYVTGSEA